MDYHIQQLDIHCERQVIEIIVANACTSVHSLQFKCKELAESLHACSKHLQIHVNDDSILPRTLNALYNYMKAEN